MLVVRTPGLYQPCGSVRADQTKWDDPLFGLWCKDGSWASAALSQEAAPAAVDDEAAAAWCSMTVTGDVGLWGQPPAGTEQLRALVHPVAAAAAPMLPSPGCPQPACASPACSMCAGHSKHDGREAAGLSMCMSVQPAWLRVCFVMPACGAGWCSCGAGCTSRRPPR